VLLEPLRFLLVFCFFFSSRRRHTRFSRDWSSDVCSSDLSYTFPKAKTVSLVYKSYTVLMQPECWTPSLGYSRKHMRYCQGTTTRSEERRVGKEWRSRRWPDH